MVKHLVGALGGEPVESGLSVHDLENLVDGLIPVPMIGVDGDRPDRTQEAVESCQFEYPVLLDCTGLVVP